MGSPVRRGWFAAYANGEWLAGDKNDDLVSEVRCSVILDQDADALTVLIADTLYATEGVEIVGAVLAANAIIRVLGIGEEGSDG